MAQSPRDAPVGVEPIQVPGWRIALRKAHGSSPKSTLLVTVVSSLPNPSLIEITQYPQSAPLQAQYLGRKT